MINDREGAFNLLFFMGADETTSLKGWRQTTRDTIKIVKDILRPFASHETNLNGPDAPPLSSVYSFFTVLCILISKEFDATLVALVNDDPVPFINLYHPFEVSPENAFDGAFDLIQHVRLEWDRAMDNRGLRPVRVLTPYEMKLCLQERGVLPRIPPKWIDSEKSHFLSKLTFGKLLLAIDPLTPPGLAAKKVEDMLREHQAKYFKEIESSWIDELEAGIVDENFVKQDVEHNRLSFNFRRAVAGNKKTRGEGTTFEIMLRRLEVYDLDRQGFSTQEIIVRLQKSYGILDGIKISQDKRQAQALVEAAVSGIPLAAVGNVRAARS